MLLAPPKAPPKPKVLTRILWEPLPKQRLALSCPVDDLLFGGAVGGGKTDFLLGAWVQHAAEYGEWAVGLIVRRTLPELKEILKRSKRLFPSLGAIYKVSERTWTFPNGALLYFGYLESDEDATRHQGQEYTFVGVDEAGAFKNPEPIDYLRSRLRSTNPVVRKRLILTANPGGSGQKWLVERYIKPALPYMPHTDPETGTQRVYIPSRLTDNPYLMKDPSYIQRIRSSGPKWLVKALLMGDWNVSVAGKIFLPEWWHWQSFGQAASMLERLQRGALPPLRTVIQAWDTDFGKGHDACAMVTLGIGHTRVYLLDWLEQSMRFPELERQVVASAARWKPSAIIIEDKASGQSLLQTLKDTTALPVVAGNKGALMKEDHWLRNSPLVEAGRLGLCKDEPSHQVFANALQACGTDAEHRDLADAFAYALDYIRDTYVFKALEAETAPQVAKPSASLVNFGMPKPPPSGRDFSLADLYRRR